jgi:hypothetical protein
MASGNPLTSTGAVDVLDDILFTIGNDADGVIVNISAGKAADSTITGVLEGTVDGRALAANSLVIANTFNDGDVAFYGSDGGNSQQFMFFDSSAATLYLDELVEFASLVTFNGTVVVAEDTTLNIGQARFVHESADADAICLVGYMRLTGDANKVPVFAWGQQTILNADLGFFNGLTEPRIAVLDADVDSYISIGHSADDLSQLLSRTNTTPTATDQLVGVHAYGLDGNASAADFRYGYIALIADNVTDTTEAGKFSVYLATGGTADNLAFYVEGNGELFADLDGDSGSYLTNGVNLFDEFDDVAELRRYQLTVPGTGLITEGQRLANRQRLRDLGVVAPKENGDMLKIQSMTRLLAGGIYQNRGYVEELEQRVKVLEDAVRSN